MFATADDSDWFLCAVTLAAAAITNPLPVIRQIWPHITVLGLFTGFVAWNGGVVLGQFCSTVSQAPY